MSSCPECDVINYGINPRCVACVRKVMGDRIAELEAELALANKTWDDNFPKLEAAIDEALKQQAELAELRDAVNTYLNLEDCVSLERLDALLPEEGK